MERKLGQDVEWRKAENVIVRVHHRPESKTVVWKSLRDDKNGLKNRDDEEENCFEKPLENAEN